MHDACCCKLVLVDESSSERMRIKTVVANVVFVLVLAIFSQQCHIKHQWHCLRKFKRACHSHSLIICGIAVERGHVGILRAQLVKTVREMATATALHRVLALARHPVEFADAMKYILQL